MGSKSSKIGGISLEEITSKIQNGEIKNIIAMCGAGISTSAGIPDFRSPSTGLYFKLRKYNLPYPEAIFTYDYFKKDPTPFYHLVRELFPDKLTPTPTHRLLTLLHEKGLLKIRLELLYCFGLITIHGNNGYDKGLNRENILYGSFFSKIFMERFHVLQQIFGVSRFS